MVQDKGPEYNRNNDPTSDECDFNEEGLTEAEYDALNNQLDQLNGWLDELERKNDSIHARLVDLLQQQRQTMDKLNEASSSRPDEPMDTSNSKQ